MTSYTDYTSPGTQFTYDLSNNTFFKKDPYNYINLLSVKQLNTLPNLSLLDIYLTKGNVIEPHYHQNATELIYCIAGSAEIALLNPFLNKYLNFYIEPGQVVNVPHGWWHYEIALTDDTHLLAIFDAPTPDVIFGSDILRLTPANVLAYTYCLDEAQLKTALAPLTNTVILGPPANCSYNPIHGQMAANQKPNQALMQQATVNQAQPYGGQHYPMYGHHHRQQY